MSSEIPEKQGGMNVEDMEDLLAEFENERNASDSSTSKCEILAEFESVPAINEEIKPMGYGSASN